MSAGDVLPYRSFNGAHTVMASGRIDATDTYEKGDVVAFDTDGSIIEAGDEPIVRGGAPGNTATTGNAVGIAMADTEDVKLFSSNETQATAESEGVQMPYVAFSLGDEYIVPAANFSSDDSNAALSDTVAAANVGDLCALRTTGTDWGVEVNTSASNRQFRIIKLVDKDGKDAVAHSTTITGIIIRLES